MALKVHKDHCGVDKPKPFKCTTCGKSFTRRATLEDHQKAHQVGGGVKRKASEQDGHLTKKVKLPNKVSGIAPADKQVSTLKGAKVDAFFLLGAKRACLSSQNRNIAERPASLF